MVPHIQAGNVRVLAVTSEQRVPELPDVPTMDELGLKGFDSTGWYGLVGPAGLPQDVVTRLAQALRTASAQVAALSMNMSGVSSVIGTASPRLSTA